MMERKNDDPRNEGHTREWQDRARVVLNAKKDAGTEASPKQSPLPDDEAENKDERDNRSEPNERDRPAY